jgi:hypothetical protein
MVATPGASRSSWHAGTSISLPCGQVAASSELSMLRQIALPLPCRVARSCVSKPPVTLCRSESSPEVFSPGQGETITAGGRAALALGWRRLPRNSYAYARNKLAPRHAQPRGAPSMRREPRATIHAQLKKQVPIAWLSSQMGQVDPPSLTRSGGFCAKISRDLERRDFAVLVSTFVIHGEYRVL